MIDKLRLHLRREHLIKWVFFNDQVEIAFKCSFNVVPNVHALDSWDVKFCLILKFDYPWQHLVEASVHQSIKFIALEVQSTCKNVNDYCLNHCTDNLKHNHKIVFELCLVCMVSIANCRQGGHNVEHRVNVERVYFCLVWFSNLFIYSEFLSCEVAVSLKNPWLGLIFVGIYCSNPDP